MSGYDAMATRYLADRDHLKSGKYVQKLLKVLPQNSLVLDLGCGAGVFVDDLLLKAGHEVWGIDQSVEQIKLARKYCPQGNYVVGDIMQLEPRQYQVDAVISIYTWFHLPRDKQQERLRIVASYLPKGGLLLITMGDREFEGKHNLHGAILWSSQYGTVKNSEMVSGAGFEVLFTEIDNSGGERHQWIMAKKR